MIRVGVAILWCTSLVCMVVDVALLLFPPPRMNYTAIEVALAISMIAVWYWGNMLTEGE